MLQENLISKKFLYPALLILLIVPLQASFSEEYYTIFKKDFSRMGCGFFW